MKHHLNQIDYFTRVIDHKIKNANKISQQTSIVVFFLNMDLNLVLIKVLFCSKVLDVLNAFIFVLFSGYVYLPSVDICLINYEYILSYREIVFTCIENKTVSYMLKLVHYFSGNMTFIYKIARYR